MRHYHPESVTFLKGAVATGDCSRSALSRRRCEIEDWRNERGELCLASARAALPKLASALDISLPDPGVFGGGRARTQPTGILSYPNPSLRCSFDDLGMVEVVPVPDDDVQQARLMMETHHPLGDAGCPGGRIRYWIVSSRHGVLGGLVFVSASWHQGARDRSIGWSDAARCGNLGRVINNDRLLILPQVRVYGLASRALALACARLADDWEAAYGERPCLAYSYVSLEHSGESYRAAGWERCSELTSGCPPGSRIAGARRSVWMKPLDADWRTVLCVEPRREMGWGSGLLGACDDWAYREYGRSRLSDGRLRSRLVEMGRAWATRAGQGLPAIFAGEA